MTTPFSTKHLDYLQRLSLGSSTEKATATVDPVPSTFRLLRRLRGVGRNEKQLPASNDRRPQLVSEQALVGICGQGMRLAFQVSSLSGSLNICCGTWGCKPAESNASRDLNTALSVVTNCFQGVYQGLSVTGNDEARVLSFARAGLVVGVPSPRLSGPTDGLLQWDRLLQAMGGSEWTSLILAEPLSLDDGLQYRNSLNAEMRAVETSMQGTQAPSPLATQYVEILKAVQRTVTLGFSLGLWKTTVLLAGDVESYPRLAAIWRGIFSGDESLPDPVRVWESVPARSWISAWNLPRIEPDASPGNFRFPFPLQSIINSAQLAAYIHLPSKENNGFFVKQIPQFDIEPPLNSKTASIPIGNVIAGERVSEVSYSISIADLTRHVFVAGVTGAGKTSSIFHILREAGKSGVDFLVLEPAKTEYRSLLADPALGAELRLYTLGNETGVPFRLNPFEVSDWPEVALSTHLDLLNSLFVSSFGMWTPLPQILDRCLLEIYRERGWNITTNRNRRLGEEFDAEELFDSFPTLTDLARKVDDVIRDLGYDDKIASDMRAALLTRINSLRSGGRGRMLDVKRSVPPDMLFKSRVVLELEGMGDDDDKAFMMGLIFLRLAEYRRAEKSRRLVNPPLRHLLVIEEAHRLLAQTGGKSSPEQGDPRGKAVEVFSNILSEIRTYGQGVVIADQVPTKLAADVIKNTNLKIAHRTVAADDRTALAGSMVMSEPQSLALATLDRGVAIVFSEGADAPLLVKVPTPNSLDSPGISEIRQHMMPILAKHSEVFASHDNCAAVRKDGTVDFELIEACDASSRIAARKSLQLDLCRFALAAAEDESGMKLLRASLLSFVQGADSALQSRSDVLSHCLRARAASWYADVRGSQAGWPYRKTRLIRELMLTSLLADEDSKEYKKSVEAFQKAMMNLHTVKFPFRHCDQICVNTSACLYKHPVQEFMNSHPRTTWDELENSEERWHACESAVQWISGPVEPPRARRIALCYGQQMLLGDDDLLTEGRVEWMSDLLVQSNEKG